MLNFSPYNEKTVTLEFLKCYLRGVCHLGETVGRT